MMKKLFFICLAITGFIASCKKELVETPVKETGSQFTSSELVYWDDLPDEYKNAVRVSPERVGSERTGEVLPKENGRSDQVFNPFNLTSTNFSITIPPYQIRKIAIGKGKYGVVSHISIWYSIGRLQSIVYVVSSGGSTSTPMATYTPLAGEYVKGFSGRSENGILKGLTIYTNKGSVSSGTSTTGTYFRFSATPGSFIGKFSGNVGTFITQLKATSYFLPWQKVSANNARDIAVDTGGTVFITDAVGTLYQMPKTATSWTRVTGAPSGVTKVAANEGYLCAIANNGKIYNCDRFTHQWTERQQINGARDIVITGQGQIFVATASGIYYNNASPNLWTHFASGNYISLACGRVNNIRAIDANGNIFSFGIYGGQMPGGNGKDIHTAFDGQIWLTNTSGKISFIHYPSITDWKEIGGLNAVRLAAIGGKVMMINREGEVYKLEF